MELNPFKLLQKTICVDGINGCGKTTTAYAIQTLLDKQGVVSDVIKIVEEPFRKLIMEDSGISDMQRALLYRCSALGAAKAAEAARVSGKWVILDRGLGSFHAFQVVAQQMAQLQYLDRIAPADFRIDYHVFLDLPVEACHARSQARSDGPDYIEDDTDAYVAQQGFRDYYIGTEQPAINKKGFLIHIQDELPGELIAGLVLSEITEQTNASFAQL